MDGKLLLSPEEASEALGVKRAQMFKMLNAGDIPSIKIGRLRRIPVEGLHRYVAAQLVVQAGVVEEDVR